MINVKEKKRRAALESIKHVKDGYVIGLGSGSTATYAISEIGRMIREEEMELLGISTSSQTTTIATTCGIPLTTLDQHPIPDIAIDGADQVDPKLDLIKGMGGAFTREKIVDSAAKALIIVVDENKLTQTLGQDQVVPVEVLPFALTPAINKIEKMNGKATVRLAEREKNPIITDNGNVIVDVDFGLIEDPRELERQIKIIPGVIDNGLFVDLADIVYVGYEKNVKRLDKR